jgi:hypothetical protein
MCDSQRGFGLYTAFTGQLQKVTTNNYNTIAISTLMKITLFASQQYYSLAVAWLTASNNAYSSASGLKCSLNSGCLTTASLPQSPRTELTWLPPLSSG